MNIAYKKIAEVEVWHDYYMAKDVNDVDYLLGSYSILDDLDFMPTQKCAELLRDKKIVFKKSPKGFQLFARSVSSTLVPGKNQTYILIDPTVVFDFFVVVKNPYFYNFTNIRLTDKGNLFRFTNSQKSAVDDTVPLTLPHPTVGNSFAVNMPFGDIIENGGKLYELKSNVTSGNAFTANDYIEISDNQRQYVSAQDALTWQMPRYEYADASNPHPGELVRFALTDDLGNLVELGDNAGTGLPQAKYRAPLDVNEALFHIIDLSKIGQGKYTLTVSRTSGNTSETFYLLDRMVEPNAFGKIELIAGDNTSGMVDSQNGESIITPKKYTIRFKNRTTIRQYFKKDGTEETDPNDDKFHPLTQQPGNFQIGGNVLPDPGVSMIYLKKDNAGKTEKIYSKTYLNQ